MSRREGADQLDQAKSARDYHHGLLESSHPKQAGQDSMPLRGSEDYSFPQPMFEMGGPMPFFAPWRASQES